MPARRILMGVVAAVVVLIVLSLTLLFTQKPSPESTKINTEDPQGIAVGERVKLPEPRYDSETSVEEALSQRRSVRAYSGGSLTLEEVSQLLWAAQGITAPWGGRAAPSAGALYPLELYVAVGDVEGLDQGVYRYIPEDHELEKVKDGDVRAELADAAVGQESVEDAAINIVFTAVYGRTTVKYDERGVRYVQMEAGHAAQNVYLQAVALDLGTVVIGAFADGEVKRIMNIEEQEEPLYIMPVGRKG